MGLLNKKISMDVEDVKVFLSRIDDDLTSIKSRKQDEIFKVKDEYTNTVTTAKQECEAKQRAIISKYNDYIEKLTEIGRKYKMMVGEDRESHDERKPMNKKQSDDPFDLSDIPL